MRPHVVYLFSSRPFPHTGLCKADPEGDCRPPIAFEFRSWSKCLQTLPGSCAKVLDNCPVISIIRKKAMEAGLLATTSTRRQFRHERPAYARTKKMSLQRKGFFIGVIVSLLLCVVLLGASHKRESEKARNELNRLKIKTDRCDRRFLLDSSAHVPSSLLKEGQKPWRPRSSGYLAPVATEESDRYACQAQASTIRLPRQASKSSKIVRVSEPYASSRAA